MNDRRQRGRAFRTAVLLLLPMLYVASFGPVCWLVDSGRIAARPVSRVYWPILFVLNRRGYGLDKELAMSYAGVGGDHPEWTLNRLLDAAGLIPQKQGGDAANREHDVPHMSSDDLEWSPFQWTER